jgi:hypothetical protein
MRKASDKKTTMNIQLIEFLANAIKALSPQERELFERKLNQKADWPSLRTKILKDATAISKRREEQSFQPDITDIIDQMREERDQELLNGLEPNEVNS